MQGLLARAFAPATGGATPLNVNGLRFDAARGGPHVESWFVKLVDPAASRALWLKGTILAPAGGAPALADAWAIAFDREHGHVAAKESVPFERARFALAGHSVEVAALSMSDGKLAGKVSAGGHVIALDLAYTTDVAPLAPLPLRAMYEGALPSSKFVSPHPDSRFHGHYVVDGRRVDVDGWRGMQGHNWGKRHAPVYAWGHVNQWDGGEALMFEGVTARVSLGSRAAPPLTLLTVADAGVRYTFSSPRTLLRARGDIGPRSWTFFAEDRVARVEGELSAPTADFVGLRYDNPSGPPTWCLNSKLASGRLRFEIFGRPPIEATTRAAAFELGTMSTAHGIPIRA